MWPQAWEDREPQEPWESEGARRIVTLPWSLLGNQPCPHLNSGLLASRTMREQFLLF